MYQTAHQNDGFHALRLCCSKCNPACLCYDSKPAKLHKARWAIQLLNHFLGVPNRASSRRFQERSSAVTFILKLFPYRIVNLLFEYFLCLHRTLGISRSKDLEGFKADIAFIYTKLACSLTIWNFDLTFVTRNFIGSCVSRCAFWLVSRKDHCLERVLRKSFWIKKSINKFPFICRINFAKYFIKAIENFFSYVCIAWYKHSRGWENSRQLCKPPNNCHEFSQPLSCLYQAMQTRKTFSIV